MEEPQTVLFIKIRAEHVRALKEHGIVAAPSVPRQALVCSEFTLRRARAGDWPVAAGWRNYFRPGQALPRLSIGSLPIFLLVAPFPALPIHGDGGQDKSCHMW